jgi:putative ABC transport system permease protein
LRPSDLKLITAIIVIFALVFPSIQRFLKQKNMARKRSLELADQALSSKRGGSIDA